MNSRVAENLVMMEGQGTLFGGTRGGDVRCAKTCECNYESTTPKHALPGTYHAPRYVVFQSSRSAFPTCITQSATSPKSTATGTRMD